MKLGWPGVFVAGIALGVAMTTVIQRTLLGHAAGMFEQRLRCKVLAETAAKKEAANWSFFDNVSVFLDRSDFSSSRNSCVASESIYGDNGFQQQQVVDIITGESLFHQSCQGEASSPEYCGNGRNVKMSQLGEAAFTKAVRPRWWLPF
jgi:hypothetical protein